MPDINTNEATKKRLNEIEQEVTTLKSNHSKLKEQWESEKNDIRKIQELKEQIEGLNQSATTFERQGDFAKVAELRYGTIPDLQKQLSVLNDNIRNNETTKHLLKEEVGPEDIAEVIAKWTGIPMSKMLETERTKLLKMEDRLKERVISQNEAINAVSNALRRSRAGLQDENRPIGSFIFLGSTGVGKTEMARALAEFLFDDEQAIVRIDMSEYMEKFSISRLIGAPPGYVGYDEGGQLTEAVRRKPYSVVLLDEIEKAHFDVFNLLLQVLDDGRLTDSKGRTVNFKNTIIIMTSNLGTELIAEHFDKLAVTSDSDILGEIKLKMLNLLKKRLRPEFLNRVDDIILFNPLTNSDILQIAELQVQILRKRIIKTGIDIKLTDEALNWLAKIGYDINFGARPLKRAVQKYIADPLALMILSSEFSTGDIIIVDTDDYGKFKFNKSE